ncbi:hypothetical protein RJE46_18070 [Cedecea neteri]|uniref:AfaD family invasin n=1 Tax=Cedecea neteri TaxID=158822 RepID=UPI002893325E|nr:hypothetical protein [Cedecea neteri]WNJ78510.1 hypothetical protein RJE46_18070 [Cedecea neteri]
MMQKGQMMGFITGVLLVMASVPLKADELDIRLQPKTMFVKAINVGDEVVSGQFSCRGKHHVWLNAEKVDDVANTYIVRGKHNQGNIIYVTLGGQGWIVDDSAERKGVTTVDTLSDTRFTIFASVNQTPRPDVYTFNVAGECLPVDA